MFNSGQWFLKNFISGKVDRIRNDFLKKVLSWSNDPNCNVAHVVINIESITDASYISEGDTPY